MSIKVNEDPRTKRELLENIEQLLGRLDEAEQTLNAIRNGDVDALVVSGPHGDQVFSLTGAERTYRLIVETMNEAALTVGLDETILFCNPRFCDLVKTTMSNTIGQKLTAFFETAQHPLLRMFLANAQTGSAKQRFMLRDAADDAVSVQIAASPLVAGDLISICLVATDLTELESQSSSIRIMREQQQNLEESRADLQGVNTLLNDSRRAALNMMEDAVAAHREIEEASADLQREIVERKRAEKELQKAHVGLELRVRERTEELSKANELLTHEIDERKKAEKSLKTAFAEIKRLKDRLQAENIYLQQEVARQDNFGEIIGQSNVLSHVFLRVKQVAPMNATVLLLGETGTGKGVIARAIHSSSVRKDRPLITVNCTTLPANLIESELFGRERGAFTGSDARQIGRFELANGGTIFLDEIGEMPMELQCKLLRVIQDGEFERLGSPRTIKTDVRIIAATNRNLEEEIKSGRFREDLFYRLNVFPITIPPLRQRKEDIPLLVNHFVAKFNKKIGKKIDTVSTDTLNSLDEYHWPGNVRELESVIERAVITSQGTALQVLDRFDTFRKTEDLVGQDIKGLVELEQDYILKVLQKTDWQIEGKNGAAILLGLNSSTLRARMRKYGIVRQYMN
jgi:formate hydrogenlyase transcriptional activator